MSEILPDEPVRLSPIARAQVSVAVTAARLLRKRRPETLRKVVTRIVHGGAPATFDATKHVRDQVLTASAHCRGGHACLIRSLAVVLVCRLRGFTPVWSVGVLAVPPFTAHAWVEAEGEIVDEPLTVTDYRAFFKIPSQPQPVDRSAGPRPVTKGGAVS